MISRRLAIAFAAFVVASALHFADNAARFDRYHDAGTHWLTPAIVIVAWFVQTIIGTAGLVLHYRGHGAGRPILMAYAILGFAGFAHYLAGMPRPDAWMHAAIALEAVAGVGLLLALVVPTRRD
jgi:O-antigen/teichoic acid export membrane protein